MNTTELSTRIRQLEEENALLRSLLEENHIPLPDTLIQTTASSSSDVQEKAPDAEKPEPQEEIKSITAEETADASLSGTLTKASPLEDRIALFMSLFYGQQQVYAKRFERKDGTPGYSPACTNSGIYGVCPHRSGEKQSCSTCPKRAYLPFDASAVKEHLEGTITAGIYALLPGDTCRFLAMDFDDEHWQEDVLVVIEVLKDYGIPYALERSRSSKGAHIWMFFEEEEDAALARRFGFKLLGQTMNRQPRLKYTSFDRLFPNQDKLPEGGLGNLIALPLQRKPAKEVQGSLFVDETFTPYRDQWAFLSSVRRVSHETISRLAGETEPSLQVRSSSVKPWTPKGNLSQNDFPETLNMVQADRLYIPLDGLSNGAIVTLRALATYSNPKFYEMVNLHKTVFNVPRYLSSADFEDNFLSLPRGCLEDVEKLLVKAGAAWEFTDERESGRPIHVSFKGTLRQEQSAALKALSAHDNGILAATTAFGKTVVGAALIAEKKVNTLILVHTAQLMDQWKERLTQFLEVEETLPEAETATRGRKKKREIIGLFGGQKDTRSGIIDIATFQSVGSKGQIKEWIQEYGMLIVDECHHVAADTFEKVIRECRARWTYGLTATPERKDGRHPTLLMYLGPIRYEVNPLLQAMLRPFIHQMIPRFTGGDYRDPDGHRLDIQQIYPLIIADDLRNAMIVEDVTDCIRENRSCLVLSERVDHIQILADAIRKNCSNTFIMTGQGNRKEKEDVLQKMREVPAEEPLVICATGKYIGEGFDEPRLDTLFLTIPISWQGTIAQYAGRLHREYEGKKEVRIYDYVDNNTEMLVNMYNKRLKGYARIGYQASASLKSAQDVEVIYQAEAYLEPFMNDLNHAQKSIRIASPCVDLACVNLLKSALSEALKRRVSIQVDCANPEAFNEEAAASMQAALRFLRELGIQVSESPDSFRRYADIDRHIVWFGGIDLLGKTKDESMLRLNSQRIADAVDPEEKA